MTTLIAELASSHGGDVGLAARMIREAAACGATHAKVQAYQTKFLSPNDPQYNWLKQAELSDSDLARLAGICHDEGIHFLATVFDEERVPLIRELSAEVKIGSGESGDLALLFAVRDANFGRVYVGTGLGNWWYVDKTESIPMFGVAAYPADDTQAMLAATLGKGLMEKGARWGYSDHTCGLDAAEFALAIGASALEVHVALAGAPKRLACDKSPTQLALVAEWCREGADLPAELDRTIEKARQKFLGRWAYRAQEHVG
jgi:sialic acid synthase SpsE